jgi:DNA (cytosine-5)-methyltransferase 1
MKINQLDLFSGIGGFHLGFERAGYEVTSYFSEIDQHAIAVYKHQFPTSTYVGSVTNVRGADLPRIDLITFGSPCQDFSLAGKRLGMEGQRSSLVLEAIRLISECRPSVFVWENVKGTFSSNDGADFWAIIQAFTDIGGYRLEWQLLNTSWFLPQNRERIYLVGYSTTPSGRGVFPIAANGRKALEPSIKQIGTKLDSNGGTQPYQQDRVYDAEGIVPALNRGKSDLIIKPNYKYEAANELVRRNTLTEGEVKGLDFYNQSVRDVIPTLTDPKHNSQGLFDGYRIRRLTPIECERLQGFPDDHTAFGNYDGVVKPMSNTQRYKQCGNAVTVDVVAAVAKNCLPLFKTNQQ